MKYFPVLLLVLSSTIVFAQQDSTVKELEEVVVTGQYKPQSLKRSVYQVKIITAERIAAHNAAKLQDILATEMNIRFSQDLATGGSDINMLGLSGQNVKILIDGLPVIGRQGTSNEININQIEVNSIERIEVIEGPMSVIYGADALGGVINIITKKASNGILKAQLKLLEETVGSEYGIKKGIHNQNLNVFYNRGDWNFSGSIGRNLFHGWKDSATERELIWHKKDQIIGTASIGFRKNGWDVRYRIDGLDEVVTNPGNYINYQQDADDSLAFDQEYLTKRVMQQLQAFYQPHKKLAFNFQSAYSDYSRQVFSTTVSKKTGDVRLNTAPGSQSIIDFTGLTLRGSSVIMFNDKTSIQPGIDINYESGNGERLAEGVNRITDIALFVTSELHPTNWLSLKPGVRFIKNSVYDAPPVMPSINAKVTLNKQLDLRLAYANGFRSPSIRELYFNFFDANHQIIGNPDLKAETSNSVTGSLTWKANRSFPFNAVLSTFYNAVDNLIDYGVSANDPNIFIYVNVGDYKSKGFNFSVNTRYAGWNFAAGFGYTARYNQFNVSDKELPEFNWSAEANTALGYSFKKLALDINLFYKYTGKLPFYQISNVSGQQLLTLVKTESYHWADLTLNKKFSKHFMLGMGIKNLFDVTVLNNTSTASVHAANGARPIGYGRSYFTAITFNLEK